MEDNLNERGENGKTKKVVKQECCSGVAGKLDGLDMKLIKLSIVSATLVFVSAFAGFRNWVASIEWYWFFIAMVIFAIRPMKRAYSNCC